MHDNQQNERAGHNLGKVCTVVKRQKNVCQPRGDSSETRPWSGPWWVDRGTTRADLRRLSRTTDGTP